MAAFQKAAFGTGALGLALLALLQRGRQTELSMSLNTQNNYTSKVV